MGDEGGRAETAGEATMGVAALGRTTLSGKFFMKATESIRVQRTLPSVSVTRGMLSISPSSCSKRALASVKMLIDSLTMQVPDLPSDQGSNFNSSSGILTALLTGALFFFLSLRSI